MRTGIRRKPFGRWSASCAITVCLLAFLAILQGCTTVQLISDYDEQTEKAVMGFHKDVETLLVKLERNAGKPEADYARHTDLYDRLKVDLSVIRMRAAMIPKNSRTIEQLDLLARTMDNLEELHRLGFERGEIQPVRAAINISCTAILALEQAKKRGRSTQ